jgi:hypothetical protein
MAENGRHLRLAPGIYGKEIGVKRGKGRCSPGANDEQENAKQHKRQRQQAGDAQQDPSRFRTVFPGHAINRSTPNGIACAGSSPSLPSLNFTLFGLFLGKLAITYLKKAGEGYYSAAAPPNNTPPPF